MRILAFILLWEFGMGLALFGYIWLQWMTSKERIEANGWKLIHCTPFEPWWAPAIFLVPGVRIFWYLLTGDLLTQLAATKKTDDYCITVGFGKMQIFYED